MPKPLFEDFNETKRGIRWRCWRRKKFLSFGGIQVKETDHEGQ
jgi:hypothetical protein